MSQLKTLQNDASVVDFLGNVDNPTRQQDGFTLLNIFAEATGEKPKMWGESIIGFGSYHYKSDRSSQEGDWPLTGFSPRKQNLTVYIMPGFKMYQKELSLLGKYKTSVSCLYINKLSDIDQKVLTQIIKHSFEYMRQQNTPPPSAKTKD